MLDLLDGILQLLVQHLAVGHHDHAVKVRLTIRAAHANQRMCGPGDGVGLAGASAVLDQIRLLRSFHAHGVDHLGHTFPLLETREDQAFLEIGLAFTFWASLRSCSTKRRKTVSLRSSAGSAWLMARVPPPATEKP